MSEEVIQDMMVMTSPLISEDEKLKSCFKDKQLWSTEMLCKEFIGIFIRF